MYMDVHSCGSDTIIDDQRSVVEYLIHHPQQLEGKYVSISRSENILDNLDIERTERWHLLARYTAI
jgi:hypothetical protein